MTIAELRAKRDKVANAPDMDEKVRANVLSKIDAQIAELEPTKKPASESKKSTTPTAKKEPKAKKEAEDEDMGDDGGSTPPPPAGKWKPDNAKDADELSCEKLIRDAKARRKKNNQEGLIKIIQTQKKSTKGDFSKEKLEEKTVQQLRVMAGFSKPRTEKLVDDARQAFDSYSKMPVKSFVQKAETPEKRKEVAEKAAQLQEKYAKEIATFVKEKELELKNELENLLK